MGMSFGRDIDSPNGRASRKPSDAADLKCLGVIVSDFLKLQPFDTKIWNRHIGKGFEDSSPGSIDCVRNILQRIMIRHRPKDLDISLPPLSHRTVFLEPSYYDRLSINLFLAVLNANAVSSERLKMTLP
jgi:hypothetical protein